jgi:DNA-binding MarR family transcriptional regulator
MSDDWKVHLRRPLPALLNETKEAAIDELHERLADEGHGAIRPGHGCVFRFIDPDHGSRLTELAERSGLTKQAVGEVVSDLERLDYVERRPDERDGRAKIVCLTDRGRDGAQAAERIFADIEARWAEQVGRERMATVREVLEEICAGAPAPG